MRPVHTSGMRMLRYLKREHGWAPANAVVCRARVRERRASVSHATVARVAERETPGLRVSALDALALRGRGGPPRPQCAARQRELQHARAASNAKVCVAVVPAEQFA